MPVMEGTQRLKTVVAEYDFAKHGGATSGTKTLNAVDSSGNYIPAGSVVTGGFVDVLTAGAGATATVDFNVESANDIAAAITVANLTLGARLSVIPAGTGATSVKTTVGRSITMDINTAALTAGKFRVTLFYV